MSDKCQKVFDEILLLVPTSRFSEIKKNRGGKLRFPIYINEKLKSTDLNALELSVRSSNCLHRAGYRTIGELVEAIDSSEDLKKIRNCGTKSIDEIMEQLFCYQYTQFDTTEKVKYIHKVLELN
ncbi:MAG: DNA-directed RNA polymerase subunit alpha C-terminal domain-containing protein [Lachnospiraceae bacterium]